jgi:hypothetical protein
VIYAFSFLGVIDEPDWSEYAIMFDESGFEIYTSRALVEVEDDNVESLSRDIKAKLNTSETLDHVRTRFFELSEFTDSLDSDEKERLLKRWEDELADFSSAFVGCSLLDWVNGENQVILF